MRFYKRHRDVYLDRNGNVIAGATVLVQTYSGADARVYSDRTGSGGLASSTLTTDDNGEYSFYAPDGLYRLTISKAGRETVVLEDVPVGNGGNEQAGVVYLADFLNASNSNGLEAMAAAIDVAANKIASTQFGRIELAVEGARFGVGDTLEIPSQGGNIAFSQWGMVYATGSVGDWLEEDTAEIAFWNKYQTVTADGKVWSLRKPLILVNPGNAGLVLDNLNYDGKGNSSVRLAAGVRVLGNTSDRFIYRGKGMNVESYGVFVGEDFANSAQIDIDGHEVKANGRVTRDDRTSYCFMNSGNDQKWTRLVGHDGHCVWGDAKFGATTDLTHCDFFNGADFDNTGYVHRLVEYRGVACTWTGDRSGNGVWFVYNPRIRFAPGKLGVTEGSGPAPPSPIRFVATEPDTDLNGFIQSIADTPTELVNSVNQYQFITEGSGSWAMPTDALSRVRGRINAVGGKNRFQQMGPQTPITIFGGPMNEGAEILIEDNNTDEAVGVGAYTNALRLWAGDMARWEVANNGVLKPMAGNTNPQFGSPAVPVHAYLQLIEGNMAMVLTAPAPDLANSQLGVRRIGVGGVQFQFRDTDGFLRTYSMPLAPENYSEPVIDLTRAPYFVDNTTSDATDAIDAAIAKAESLGGATILWATTFKSKGGHKATGRVNFRGLNLTETGLERIYGDGSRVGPMLELLPYDGRQAGIRRHQFLVDFKIDGEVVHVTKTTGTVTAGSPIITGLPPEVVTAAVNGHMLEAYGLPENALIIGKPTSTSLEVSKVADLNNTGKTKIVIREAVTRTATATAGNKVLAMANTSGIKPGMRMLGVNLETDGDDLSSWSRVISIVPNVSVTMDRPAATPGAFSCTFYAYPENILVVEANQAPSYDPDKEYEQVTIKVRMTQAGGDQIVVRPGRDQVHIMPECKPDLGYGFGIRMTASNDSYILRANTGSNWKGGILLSAMATPRFCGETYDPYLTDKYFALAMQGMRECTVVDSDINGQARFTGKAGEDAPLVTLIAVNNKFHKSDMNPGGQTNAYLTLKNIILNVLGGGFKGDRQAVPASSGRPNYIAYMEDTTSRINIMGTNWTDNPANDACPYQIAPCNNMAQFFAQRVDGTTRRLIEREELFTPTLSCAAPGNLSVAYALQEGFGSLRNGMVTVRIVLAFKPTYSSASGAIKIMGLPSWMFPAGDMSDPQIQVAVDSANCDWGAGYTQLYGRVKSAGSIAIDKAGDNLATTQMVIASCTSDTDQRFEFWGTWKV